MAYQKYNILMGMNTLLKTFKSINSSIIQPLRNTTMNDLFLRIAEYIDAYRIVPRILLFSYGYLVWYVVNWYMGIQTPTTEQTFLVTTIAGLSTAVIGLYQTSGRNWKEYRKELNMYYEDRKKRND
jgi:hypothetical protein